MDISTQPSLGPVRLEAFARSQHILAVPEGRHADKALRNKRTQRKTFRQAVPDNKIPRTNRRPLEISRDRTNRSRSGRRFRTTRSGNEQIERTERLCRFEKS